MRTLGGTVAVLAMLSLAACAPTGAADEKPPRSAPHTASSSPSAEASSAPQTAADLPTVEGEIGKTIDLDTGISVSVDAVTPVQVEAKTPGERSGSAVVVDVTATNVSAEPTRVDSAVVTLTADDGEVGIGTTAGEPVALGGEIGAGEKAVGRYVFMLGSPEDRAVSVYVNYAAGAPAVIFTGKAS